MRSSARRHSTLTVLGLLFAIALCGNPAWSDPPAPETVRALARDIYPFAYPLLLMDLTRQQATADSEAGAEAESDARAPLNHFSHERSYAKADKRVRVRPSFDALHSRAWVDLRKEPLILSLPDAGDGHYVVQALDMWSEVFASLGTRTTGNGAANLALVAPGWKGKLPDGIPRVEAPTATIWLIAGFQTGGPTDFEGVHALQDALKLTPLAQWGKAVKPAASAKTKPAKKTNDRAKKTAAPKPEIDLTTPPAVQIGKLGSIEFLARAAELMKKFPPHGNDYPLLLRMRAIGLEPGKDWDGAPLDQATRDAIDAGSKDAQRDIAVAAAKLGTEVNGWHVLAENVGTYGTSYLRRAAIAHADLGAAPPADTLQAIASFDKDGQALNGSDRYIIHFEKGRLPPATALWSLTLYDAEGFPVTNPLGRYAIGNRDKLSFNEDGSLDLYIQADSPGPARIPNWLPAPKTGPITPLLRLYAPRRDALNGDWVPPPLHRTNWR